MHPRLMALPTLGALLALSAGPAPAVAAAPKPAATPLKTISHIYVKPLCTGLRRSIAPAVGRVLQNDRVMAASRPLFQGFAKNSDDGSRAATDMDVMRLEQLITPLVKNTQAIEKLLDDTVYLRRPKTDEEKQLFSMRAHLEGVLAQQKHALDLISGFVDTQNMAELQAAGRRYDAAINSADTKQAAAASSQTPQTSPTAAPAPILNAGLSSKGDPARQYDPRFKNTGSDIGYNPLHAFDEQMAVYQQTITPMENAVSKEIFKAIPECGGRVPAQPAPAPSAPGTPGTPVPALSPPPGSKP